MMCRALKSEGLILRETEPFMQRKVTVRGNGLIQLFETKSFFHIQWKGMNLLHNSFIYFALVCWESLPAWASAIGSYWRNCIF